MPWPRKTSTCRSFVTISSGLCRLFAIVVLLHGQNHTSRWTRSMGVDQSSPPLAALDLGQGSHREPQPHQMDKYGSEDTNRCHNRGREDRVGIIVAILAPERS